MMTTFKLAASVCGGAAAARVRAAESRRHLFSD